MKCFSTTLSCPVSRKAVTILANCQINSSETAEEKNMTNLSRVLSLLFNPYSLSENTACANKRSAIADKQKTTTAKNIKATFGCFFVVAFVTPAGLKSSPQRLQ